MRIPGIRRRGTRHKAENTKKLCLWKCKFWHVIILVMAPIIGAGTYWLLASPAVVCALANMAYSIFLKATMSTERGDTGTGGVHKSSRNMQRECQMHNTPYWCECHLDPNHTHIIHPENKVKKNQQTLVRKDINKNGRRGDK